MVVGDFTCCGDAEPVGVCPKVSSAAVTPLERTFPLNPLPRACPQGMVPGTDVAVAKPVLGMG